MSEDERSRLAYAIQGIMADELWADPDFDVNGTGPASFKIADLLRSDLANARNAALEAAKEIERISSWNYDQAGEIEDLRSDLSNVRNAAWDAGYLAGFKASGEGWNGEYPFDGTDPAEDALWLERRNTYRVLAALKAEGESRE